MISRNIKTEYTKTSNGGARMTAKAYYNGECVQYERGKKILSVGYNHAKSLEENHDSVFMAMCRALERDPLRALPKKINIEKDRHVFFAVGEWVKGQCDSTKRVYSKYRNPSERGPELTKLFVIKGGFRGERGTNATR